MDIINIGLAIAAVRRRNGITQAALAEKAGMKTNALCMLETGTYNDMKFSTIKRIAAALGIAPSALMNAAENLTTFTPPDDMHRHSFVINATLRWQGQQSLRWFITANDYQYYPPGKRVQEISRRVIVNIPKEYGVVNGIPDGLSMYHLIRPDYDAHDGNLCMCFIRFANGEEVVEPMLAARAVESEVQVAIDELLDKGLWLSVPTAMRNREDLPIFVVGTAQPWTLSPFDV